MNIEKMTLAIMFKPMYVGELVIYNPVRPLLGTLNKESMVFTEFMTGRKFTYLKDFFELNMPECFSEEIDIKDLLQDETKDLTRTIQEYWQRYEKSLWLLGINEGDDFTSLIPFSKKDILKIFNITVIKNSINTEDINRLITEYENDNITPEELSEDINSIDPSNNNRKVLKVDFSKGNKSGKSKRD